MKKFGINDEPNYEKPSNPPGQKKRIVYPMKHDIKFVVNDMKDTLKAMENLTNKFNFQIKAIEDMIYDIKDFEDMIDDIKDFEDMIDDIKESE